MKRAPQTCTLRRAFTDPKLFAAALGDLTSWLRWLAILLAAFGERLTPEEQLRRTVYGSREVIFLGCAGRASDDLGRE